MNGSFIVFCLMLVLPMFFGRVWCGYICPAGGLQECAMRVNDNPAKLGKRERITDAGRHAITSAGWRHSWS
ncbi:MAG: 4Fe-4S binding protein [Lachnospiraceae bacterium]|nr:4Fe-4S binding protein [Lachnospiraceae bacterium]